MIKIGLPQEHITLKRLNTEQAKLFDCGNAKLNIGVYVRESFYGLISFDVHKGYLWLKYFHVFYGNFPYVLRRMAKYVQQFLRATKKRKLLFSQALDWFNTNPIGSGVHFFKHYFKIMEIYRDKEKVVFELQEG